MDLYGICAPLTTTCTATFTVLNYLTAPTIAASQTICYNTAPAQLIMLTLPTGGSGSFTYQWQNSPDGTTWTDIVGATTITYSPPVLTATTYYQIVATDAVNQFCGSIASNVVTITVNPNVTPTFTQIGPLCQNSVPPTLPGISLEGITGTWNPSSINTTIAGALYLYLHPE